MEVEVDKIIQEIMKVEKVVEEQDMLVVVLLETQVQELQVQTDLVEEVVHLVKFRVQVAVTVLLLLGILHN